MTLDNGIVLVVIFVAAIAAATVVWFVLRKNLPPDVATDIAQAAALVRSLLGSVVTQAEIEALAGWIYDQYGKGSNYIPRDQFIALVVRAVLGAATMQDTAIAEARMAGLVV